jgi:hypothetical protein
MKATRKKQKRKNNSKKRLVLKFFLVRFKNLALNGNPARIKAIIDAIIAADMVSPMLRKLILKKQTKPKVIAAITENTSANENFD